MLLKEKYNNDIDKLYELYKVSYAYNIDFGEYSEKIGDISTREKFEDFINNELNDEKAIHMYFFSRFNDILHSITLDNYPLDIKWSVYDEVIRRLTILELYREYTNTEKYKNLFKNDFLIKVSYTQLEDILKIIENFYREILDCDFALMYLENERYKSLNKPSPYSENVITIELMKHPIKYMKVAKMIDEIERSFPKI